MRGHRLRRREGLGIMDSKGGYINYGRRGENVAQRASLRVQSSPSGDILPAVQNCHCTFTNMHLYSKINYIMNQATINDWKS